MRLNLKAITLTAGIIWAFAIFITGIINGFFYGAIAFLFAKEGL